MPVPTDYTEVNVKMTNLDHNIDPGMDEILQTRDVFGRHAAWNFNSIVYWKDGQFHADVWVYRRYRETLSADTLKDLMRKTNDIYGWD